MRASKPNNSDNSDLENTILCKEPVWIIDQNHKLVLAYIVYDGGASHSLCRTQWRHNHLPHRMKTKELIISSVGNIKLDIAIDIVELQIITGDYQKGIKSIDMTGRHLSNLENTNLCINDVRMFDIKGPKEEDRFKIPKYNIPPKDLINSLKKSHMNPRIEDSQLFDPKVPKIMFGQVNSDIFPRVLSKQEFPHPLRQKYPNLVWGQSQLTKQILVWGNLSPITKGEGLIINDSIKGENGSTSIPITDLILKERLNKSNLQINTLFFTNKLDNKIETHSNKMNAFGDVIMNEPEYQQVNM